MKFILDKFFEQTKGFYPFFKVCPKCYWEYYLTKRATNTVGYEYNWKNPKTLNEKIRYLIYNEKLDLKTKLTDKILVKQYIASKLGKNHSAELYGIYNKVDEIDFSVLPDKFALKANHGWRMNIFVENKASFKKEYKKIKTITNKWLKINYEQYSIEPQYRNIKRKLFIEYLRPYKKEESLRNDIQVWCFNSIPLFIEINNIFYNTSWEKLKYTYRAAQDIKEIPRPERLDEILEMAKTLAQGFSFVRIDFIVDDKDIHVLEMTFTPGSAMIPFRDKNFDIELGNFLSIPMRGEYLDR